LRNNQPSLPQLFKGIALFTPGGDLIYCIDSSKQGRWHLHLCAALQDMLGLPEPPHFLIPGYTATIDKWIDPRTQQLRTAAELYRPVQHHQALLNALFGSSNLHWQVASWQQELWEPMVLETYRHQFPQLWEDHDLIVRLGETEKLFYPYSSVRKPKNQVEAYPTTSTIESRTKVNLPHQDKTLSSTQEFPTPERPVDAQKITGEVWEKSHQILNPSGAIKIKEQTNDSRLLQPSPTDARDISPNLESPNTVGYVLRLFISGHSETTEEILKNLHHLLENSLRHPYTLKIVDIFKHPEQAEENQISATPTLLRVWPQPARRIVGDFNNFDKILRVLTTSSTNHIQSG